MVREIISAVGNVVSQCVFGTGKVAGNVGRAAFTPKEEFMRVGNINEVVRLFTPEELGKQPVHYATNFLSEHIGEGIRQVKTGGLFTEVGKALKILSVDGFKGNGKLWSNVVGAMGKVGIRGGLVIGAVGLLGFAGYGIFKNGVSEAKHKWWAIQHGWVPDMSDSAAVWGILTVSKGLGLAGALMTLFPPTTLLGISSMVAGGSVAWLTDKYRKLYYGTNWITAPESIQIPYAEGIARSIGSTTVAGI